MTKEQAAILFEKNGTQFNLYTFQYLLAFNVYYYLTYLDVNQFLSISIFVSIMMLGIWNVKKSLIGKIPVRKHLYFRLIAIVALLGITHLTMLTVEALF